MLERTLKDMMAKFQKLGQGEVKRVNKRVRINTAVVEDIATADVEASIEWLHGTQLKPHYLGTCKAFTLEFLARIAVDDSLPWDILWTEDGIDKERYRKMLQIYVTPTLQQRIGLQETIFVHDGAPPHNAISVQPLLR
ncbi:hypothetical protein TNCV_1867331 [Trichonephila clavipes]|nr:hypothetical protein TNCV_1867331 [Trichonephila clavipes]